MFTDTENWEISKLLAAILHLGNLQYEGEGPRWCTPSPTPPWVQGQHNTSLPGGAVAQLLSQQLRTLFHRGQGCCQELWSPGWRSVRGEGHDCWGLPLGARHGTGHSRFLPSRCP